MGIPNALAFLPVLSIPLAAQQASYRFPTSDTLEYREIIDARIVLGPPRIALGPPRGPVTLTARNEATIALAAASGDTVVASYDELTLSGANPEGDWRLVASAVLRLPFRLLVTSAGHVTTLSAPAFPLEINSRADLSRQFQDFFISLPPSALRPLVTWVDTVESSQVGNPQDEYNARHIRRYRARRDTILADGTAAIVIDFEQEITVRWNSQMRNVTFFTRLEGREEGTALFAPAAARLVMRVRRAHLDGEQVLRGEARELTRPISYEYSSSLVALR